MTSPPNSCTLTPSSSSHASAEHSLPRIRYPSCRLVMSLPTLFFSSMVLHVENRWSISWKAEPISVVTARFCRYSVCMSAGVALREREREKEREREREGGRERERERERGREGGREGERERERERGRERGREGERERGRERGRDRERGRESGRVRERKRDYKFKQSNRQSHFSPDVVSDLSLLAFS